MTENLAGLGIVMAGDEVWVAAGEYHERVALVPGVGLYGGFAGDEPTRIGRDLRTSTTVLDGDAAGSVVTIAAGGPDTVIEGFTIRNGRAVYGGGIYCNGCSPTIANNTITSNVATSRGGGIYYNYLGSPGSIRNNIIVQNLAEATSALGGGLYLYGLVQVHNNTVLGNISRAQGGGIYTKTSTSIVNNVVVGNSSYSYGGGVICGTSTILRNNDVWGNSSQTYPGSANYYGALDPTGTNGNISEDPCLIDFARLASGSPCLEAGDDNVVQSGWVDMDGEPRIMAGHIDIGADEFQNDVPLVVADSAVVTTGVGQITTSSGKWSDANGDPVSLSVSIGTIETQSDGTWTWTYIPPDTSASAIVTITAEDTNRAFGQTTFMLQVLQGPPKVIYVSSLAGDDSNDGLSWSSAKRTVTAGLGDAIAGDDVWVAAGQYHERITLRSGVGLYGGFAGNETARADRDSHVNAAVLDGDAAGTVVTVTQGGSDTVIDGFTIRNGQADYGLGAAIQCTNSSPTIANNLITSNLPGWWGAGAICCYYSSPTIIYNTISNNAGYEAGGIYCRYSHSTIANNVITGNSCHGNGGGITCSDGGDGLPSLGRVTIISNTIVGNVTYGSGGGVQFSGGSATIVNNIVVGNCAYHIGGGLSLQSDGVHTPTWELRNNDVWGNTSTMRTNSEPEDAPFVIDNYFGIDDPTGTNGNISADPMFVDGLRLQPASPCRDAGDSSVIPLDWVDMDLQPRIFGVAADIGAYECTALTNNAPTVTSDASAVSVEEGRTASNTGTCVDTDGDAVALSASIGEVAATGSTWSWTCCPTDGPADSTVVTITADDGKGGVAATTFSLTVSNVAPPAAINGVPGTCSEGTSVALTGSATDQSSADTAAGFAYAWSVSRNGTAFTSSSGSGFSFVPTDDGVYVVTLEVTDKDGAVGSASDSINVGNLPPTVTIAGPSSGAVYATGESIGFTGAFSDPGILDTHSAVWTFTSATEVVRAESVGIVETDGSGSVADHISSMIPGVYYVQLNTTDKDGATGYANSIGDLPAMFVVYDPTGGFVTGGGWIASPAGAYRLDTTLTGKASFGFVSKYRAGATVPEGQTEFVFKVADFRFHSTSYDWLVVAGARAQFKGTGQINGTGDYGFMITGIDGQVSGGAEVDRFRIKIWDRNSGGIIYDNQHGSDDNAGLGDSTVLGGGSIVIHKG